MLIFHFPIFMSLHWFMKAQTYGSFYLGGFLHIRKIWGYHVDWESYILVINWDGYGSTIKQRARARISIFYITLDSLKRIDFWERLVADKKNLSTTLTDVITRRPRGASTTLPYLISSAWFIKENLIPCLGKAKIGHIVNQLRFLGIYRVDPHLIKAINVLLRTPSEARLRIVICFARSSFLVENGSQSISNASYAF